MHMKELWTDYLFHLVQTVEPPFLDSESECMFANAKKKVTSSQPDCRFCSLVAPSSLLLPAFPRFRTDSALSSHSLSPFAPNSNTLARLVKKTG